MYKILHLIFGWDYIYWQNTADEGYAWVHKLPNGTIWYKRYWITNVIDVIYKSSQVLWMSCKPNKYFPDEN